jgi:hypothetical protein
MGMDTILSWASAVLGTTSARWMSLTGAVPAELLTRPAAAGEWSALDCLQHLVDTERMVFPDRVRHLLAGEDFPNFDPDSQGTAPDVNLSAAVLAESFAAMRAESMALLETLTVADLDLRSRHSELGIISMRELLHEWAGHDLMHTVQAERALMQPFIAGCGPWKSYFADHLAG